MPPIYTSQNLYHRNRRLLFFSPLSKKKATRPDSYQFVMPYSEWMFRH